MLNPISIIRRCEQNYIRNRVDSYHLHPMEALTLCILYRTGECNQDALCVEMNVDKGRIAKTVSSLEDRGYLERSVNPVNKREKQLRLTKPGTEMALTVNKIFADWNALCFSGFTQEEQDQYMAFIDRIAHNAAESRKEFRQHD